MPTTRVRGHVSTVWNAARDYIGNASVEVVLTAAGLVSGIVIARVLGPTGRGQFTAALMWPSVLGSLLSFGLQHACAYASGAGWRTPRSLHRLGVVYAIAVGLPAAALYWTLCPWLFQRSFGSEFWIPRLFSIGIPLSMYVGMLMPIYQGCGDFRHWNTARLFRGLGWTAVAVVFAAFNVMSVTRMLAAQVAIMVTTGLYLALLLPSLRAAGPSEEAVFGRLARYGLAVYLSSVAYLMSQQLDQLLLSMWVDPAELGYYATAATVSTMLLVIPSALGPVAFSKIARGDASHPERRNYVRDAITLGLCFIAPAGLVLTLLAPYVVRMIYGPAFDRSGRVLLVLAPAASFLAIAQLMADILRGAGKPMAATHGTIIAAVITAAGLPFALPRYGIFGAAWVSLVAYLFMAVIQGWGIWTWARRSPVGATRTTRF